MKLVAYLIQKQVKFIPTILDSKLWDEFVNFMTI